MDYGFPDWKALRHAVLSISPSEDYVSAPAGESLILHDPPGGLAGANRFAAAYSMVLSYMGASADVTTVAGDSGLAFILQADSLHRPFDTNIEQLDIGYWPNGHWGAMLRLDFLSRAYGMNLRQLPFDMSEYKAGPAENYQKWHEREVTASLRAGRPVIGVARDIYAVFGWDGGNPPLLGQLSCDSARNIHRLDTFPWVVVVADEAGEPVDRLEADREALAFALRLARDEVDLSDLPGKSTGRCSWELWLRQLENERLCGPHFYHANVVGNLLLNRRTAAAYLRDMSKRHDSPASDALAEAASRYDAVSSSLGQADTSEEALSSSAGRGRLIAVIRESVDLEAGALEQMAEALSALPKSYS